MSKRSATLHPSSILSSDIARRRVVMRRSLERRSRWRSNSIFENLFPVPQNPLPGCSPQIIGGRTSVRLCEQALYLRERFSVRAIHGHTFFEGLAESLDQKEDAL